ncbi:hypothetical protein HLB23_15555 [Nocardia uniformis]|uniref:Uncharacterized protein n=1 Tax=Nocardia uniformis TaxID=53432 RepID=A0A849C487_9NOCA|nr:hypothetical protein [Nocardia uniformis]NNH71260.1 hypothetical protein [Nocardia uniformis]
MTLDPDDGSDSNAAQHDFLECPDRLPMSSSPRGCPQTDLLNVIGAEPVRLLTHYMTTGDANANLTIEPRDRRVIALSNRAEAPASQMLTVEQT